MPDQSEDSAANHETASSMASRSDTDIQLSPDDGVRAPTDQRSSRSSLVFAWLIITVGVVGFFWMQQASSDSAGPRQSAGTTTLLQELPPGYLQNAQVIVSLASYGTTGGPRQTWAPVGSSASDEPPAAAGGRPDEQASVAPGVSESVEQAVSDGEPGDTLDAPALDASEPDAEQVVQPAEQSSSATLLDRQISDQLRELERLSTATASHLALAVIRGEIQGPQRAVRDLSAIDVSHLAEDTSITGSSHDQGEVQGDHQGDGQQAQISDSDGSAQHLDGHAGTVDSTPVESAAHHDPVSGDVVVDQIADQRPAAVRAMALLEAVYRDGSASIDAEQRAWLQQQLGWLADLALVFDQSSIAPERNQVMAVAHDRLFALTLVSGAVVALAVGSIVMVVLVLVLAIKGSIRWRYRRDETRATVWAWIFALFPPALFVVSIMSGVAVFLIGPTQAMWLMWSIVLMIPLYLLMLRHYGVSSRGMRAGFGLDVGAGWWREVSAGVLGYLAGAPLVVVVAVISLALAPEAVQNSSHPLQELFESGAALADVLPMIILAVLWAPIVEELIFRGALYHHLRAWVPVMPSAILQGVIFAAVHPQGIALIPILAAVGVVFAYIREWRGSIIAPMVAHSLHNGVIVGFALASM